MIIIGIIGIIAVLIGFILSTKAFAESDHNIHITGTAYLGGTIIVLGIWCISSSKSPKAIDVYRGKTTLQITYKDNMPIDTTVIYK